MPAIEAWIQENPLETIVAGTFILGLISAALYYTRDRGINFHDLGQRALDSYNRGELPDDIDVHGSQSRR